MEEKRIAAKPERKALIRGILITLSGAALWGCNGTLVKCLMDRYAADPLWIACFRQLGCCGLFLLAARIEQKGRVTALVHDRKAMWGILGVALGSFLLSQVAYLMAIAWTNSATATVLQSLQMLICLTYVCIKVKRRPRKRELLGAVLALVGTYLIATGGNPGQLQLPLMGIFWGFMAAVAGAILAIQPAKLLGQWGSFAVNGVGFLISGIILTLFFQPWNHMPALDGFGWLLIILSITLGTFGAYGLYLQGVKEVGSLRATLLGTMEPVMATVTSIVWMGTVFDGATLIGFVLVVAMVYLTA